jgi:hypothetical protein
MVTTSALGRGSFQARARRLPDSHQQHQADCCKGVATVAHRRLALVAVVIVMWSNDLDVIFIMFGVSCISCELM